jgi:predicted N-acetyltransferase YhbS
MPMGGSSLKIRLEEPSDYRTVEELTRAAFNNPDRVDRSKINCPMEHHMVHSLRKKDGIMALNFVAEIDGRIVGHIIYSHAHILQPDGSEVAVLNFGPISVWPELQRSGIGSALMKYSIEKARELGFGAILFFGHPDYYPRFGFVEASEFGITDCNGENYPAFMAMELKRDFLKSITGKFIEADIYNDDLNPIKMSALLKPLVSLVFLTLVVAIWLQIT